MSNKSNKSGKVPRLRFPEFRDAGEWESALLGKLLIGSPDYGVNAAAVPFADNLPKYLRITDISEDGQYLPDKQVSVDLNATDQNYLDEGDIVLARTGASVGKSYRYRKEDGKLVFAGFLIRVKPDPMLLISTYLANFLTTDHFWKWVAVTSARSGQPGINSTEYSSLAIPLPPNFPEQQKIADCLSSLDELIAAQSQKLAALKDHKKGLMQQLFPAEGETVPKLRFPEFREAGEWEEKRLGDVGSVRMCKRIFKEQTSPRGDIPFYKIGTFGGVPDAYISRELFESFRNNFPFPKNGAVLISAAGTIGRTVRYKGELAYFQDSNIVWLDNSENLIADNFLSYLYQLIDWSPSVGAIQRLYNENILGAQVKFPSIPEQQKIADCLSSLDELIAAKSQKLDALKVHKKGLMQQLFPAIDVMPA